MARFGAGALGVTALWWLVLAQDALAHQESVQAVAYFLGAVAVGGWANVVHGKGQR